MKQSAFFKNIFKKSSFKSSFIGKNITIPISIGLIVVICLVYVFSFHIYQHSAYKKLLTENYSNILDYTSQEIENSVMQTVGNAKSLADDVNFADIFRYSPNKEISDAQIDGLCARLGEFKTDNQIVDTVILFERAVKKIITPDGICGADSFLSEQYNFEEYNVLFWNNFINPLQDYQILPPSKVTLPDGEKNILPVVFTKIADIESNNLLVICVDINSLILKFKSYDAPPQTNFYLVNNRTLRVFPTPQESISSILNNEIYNSLIKSASHTGVYKDASGNEFLITTLSPTRNIMGYSYLCAISTDFINQKLKSSMLYVVIISILFFAVILLLSFVTTKSHNEIVTKNTLLEQKHMIISPFIRKKLLADFLNSSTDSSYGNSYGEYKRFEFNYEYFAAVAVRFVFFNAFSADLSNESKNSISEGISGVLNTTFSQDFDTTVLNEKESVFYIILNFDNPSESVNNRIAKHIDTIKGLFEYDKEYVKLQFGISEIHRYISGLKTAYSEADKSLSLLAQFNSIEKYSYSSENKKMYIFSQTDETKLYNYIISLKKDEAKKHLENIIKNNVNNHTSEKNMIKLYSQILVCIFKALATKGISYSTDDKSDVELISEIILCSPEEINNFMINLIEKATHNNVYKGKIEIEDIIEFINAHYCECTLCLDEIAKKFNVTPKHLSKKIKSSLGVNFSDFLAQTRIEKAKQLILESDNSLNEIYLKIGFTNRNTFIRNFKTVVGFTPSEYKKQKRG